MGNIRQPRHGSMQYWPRKRAETEVAPIRFWPVAKDTRIVGFSGYKVGMVHAMVTDTKTNSATKGMVVSWPLTIIECPPLTVFSIRFYKNGLPVGQIFAEKLDKHLARSIQIPKKKVSFDDMKKDFDDIRLIVHTNPGLTNIGKKKPEIFELVIGSVKDEKLVKAKELLGKNVTVNEVFKNGQYVDAHAVSKGKGLQGPVKRFGVALRSHKSEKTKRGPASLGAWCGQQHMMYRVAHAGQMGYHTRTEFNKQIVKIIDKPETINTPSGFPRYGVVKNQYMLIKGSVPGANKRLVKFCLATRPSKGQKELDYEIKVIQ